MFRCRQTGVSMMGNRRVTLGGQSRCCVSVSINGPRLVLICVKSGVSTWCCHGSFPLHLLMERCDRVSFRSLVSSPKMPMSIRRRSLTCWTKEFRRSQAGPLWVEIGRRRNLAVVASLRPFRPSEMCGATPDSTIGWNIMPVSRVARYSCRDALGTAVKSLDLDYRAIFYIERDLARS